MANRVVRDGILDSDLVNKLSWPGEVFYRRLMSVVDDYGRGDGRAAILRSKLYPLKLDKVSEADLNKWISECVEAGLVSKYEVGGKPYFEILNFNQQVRIKKSKYPGPPKEGNLQVIANDIICPPETKPIETEKNIITIGKDRYFVLPSKIIADNYQKRFESIMMSKLAGVNPKTALEKFDKEYPFYDFSDVNHFFNALVSCVKTVNKQVKKVEQTTVSERIYGKKTQ